MVRPASLRPATLSRLLADYGMLGVLLLLCVCCTVGTIQHRRPVGRHAAERVAGQLTRDKSAQVVIISGDTKFADAVERLLRKDNIPLVKKITGQRATMRKELEQLIEQGRQIDILATTLADLQIVKHVATDCWPAMSLRDLRLSKKPQQPWFFLPPAAVLWAHSVITSSRSDSDVAESRSRHYCHPAGYLVEHRPPDGCLY